MSTVPTASDAQSVIQKVEAFASKLVNIAPSQDILPTVIATAQAAIAVFAPEAALGGIAVSKLLSLGAALWAEEPAAVSAISTIKDALSGGAAPTPEQWAALDSAADAAHAKLQSTQ